MTTNFQQFFHTFCIKIVIVIKYKSTVDLIIYQGFCDYLCLVRWSGSSLDPPRPRYERFARAVIPTQLPDQWPKPNETSIRRRLLPDNTNIIEDQEDIET